MKRVVTVILAVLLLTPGIGAAADKKAALGPPVPEAAMALPQKLDLNRVSQEDLVSVPGIGPRMAQAIVDLRTKKGEFKKIEELLEVTGIKEKKLASITGYFEVIPLPASAPITAAPQPR